MFGFFGKQTPKRKMSCVLRRDETVMTIDGLGMSADCDVGDHTMPVDAKTLVVSHPEFSITLSIDHIAAYELTDRMVTRLIMGNGIAVQCPAADANPITLTNLEAVIGGHRLYQMMVSPALYVNPAFVKMHDFERIVVADHVLVVDGDAGRSISRYIRRNEKELGEWAIVYSPTGQFGDGDNNLRARHSAISFSELPLKGSGQSRMVFWDGSDFHLWWADRCLPMIQSHIIETPAQSLGESRRDALMALHKHRPSFSILKYLG